MAPKKKKKPSWSNFNNIPLERLGINMEQWLLLLAVESHLFQFDIIYLETLRSHPVSEDDACSCNNNTQDLRPWKHAAFLSNFHRVHLRPRLHNVFRWKWENFTRVFGIHLHDTGSQSHWKRTFLLFSVYFSLFLSLCAVLWVRCSRGCGKQPQSGGNEANKSSPCPCLPPCQGTLPPQLFAARHIYTIVQPKIFFHWCDVSVDVMLLGFFFLLTEQKDLHYWDNVMAMAAWKLITSPKLCVAVRCIVAL